MSQRRQFMPANGPLTDNTKTPFSEPAFQTTPALVSTNNDINNGVRLNLGGIKKNSRLPRGPDHLAQKSPSHSQPQVFSMNSHAARASLPKTFAPDIFQSRPISSASPDPLPPSLQRPAAPTRHFRPQLSAVMPENSQGPNMSNSSDFSFSHGQFRAEKSHLSFDDSAKGSLPRVASSVQQVSQDQKFTIAPISSTMPPDIQMRSPTSHSLTLRNEDEYNQGIGERSYSSADGAVSEQYERSGEKRSRTSDMDQGSDDDGLIERESFKRQRPDDSYNNDAVKMTSRTRTTYRQTRQDDPIQTATLDALLREDSDTVFSAHSDRVGDLRQKWNTCTLEEWQQAGNDITKKFGELIEFAQEYMRAKLGMYGLLHARTDHRNKRVLDLRDERLKQARETLVSQTGALVGNSK